MIKPPSPPLTHFICLPLRSPDFRNRVVQFNGLLPQTIPPSIFRPNGSLHFTLGVLSLPTPEEIERAVSFLQSWRHEVLGTVNGENLKVRMKGIASMQGNLKRTCVIYAVPEDGDGRLRLLSNLLQSKFKEAELLIHDKHAAHEVKPRPKKRYKAVIDATEIFGSEELKNFDFGEVDIEQVQICEMGAKDVDGEIRYKSVGGFKLQQYLDVTVMQENDEVVKEEVMPSEETKEEKAAS